MVLRFGWQNPWHFANSDFGDVQVNHLFYGDTSTGRGGGLPKIGSKLAKVSIVRASKKQSFLKPVSPLNRAKSGKIGHFRTFDSGDDGLRDKSR